MRSLQLRAHEREVKLSAGNRASQKYVRFLGVCPQTRLEHEPGVSTWLTLASACRRGQLLLQLSSIWFHIKKVQMLRSRFASSNPQSVPAGCCWKRRGVTKQLGWRSTHRQRHCRMPPSMQCHLPEHWGISKSTRRMRLLIGLCFLQVGHWWTHRHKVLRIGFSNVGDSFSLYQRVTVFATTIMILMAFNILIYGRRSEQV